MDIELVTQEQAQDILSMRKNDNGVMGNQDTSSRPLIKIDRLPSNFIGYPKGTVISYDPITLGELEAINNGTNVDIERGIAMLLKAIHCNTLSSQDLYYWDVMYIGIKRKILAFGDTRGIACEVCPKCGTIVKKEYDYTDIDFKQLKVPDLPIITTIQGVKVEINLLTIKDFLELDEDSTNLDVYAKMIKNLDFEEALKLIKSCTGKDAKTIRYIDNILDYGIQPFKVKCDGIITHNKDNKDIQEPCNNEILLEVTSPFEVVFPEDEDFGYNDFEIQFGGK